MEKQVEILVGKAVEAKSSDEALRYSQAALNAANAMRVLIDSKQQETKG